MATQLLVNVLTVTNLAGGASTTVPHGLRAGDQPVTPTQVLCDRNSSIAVSAVTDTTVTFTNLSPTVPATANFRAEYDHSIHAVGVTPIRWRGYTPPVTTVGQAVFGQFSDTSDQPLTSGTNYIAHYNTIESSNGITLANDPISGRPTRITVPQDGVYEFCCSPQLLHTGGGTVTVTFWARLDGVNIPRSASSLEMGNNNNRTLPYVSLILPMTAGQFLEWDFYAVGTNTSLETFPAVVGPPAVPQIPAIIVSAKLIGS
jgi:hypothetical protein